MGWNVSLLSLTERCLCSHVLKCVSALMNLNVSLISLTERCLYSYWLKCVSALTGWKVSLLSLVERYQYLFNIVCKISLNFFCSTISTVYNYLSERHLCCQWLKRIMFLLKGQTVSRDFLQHFRKTLRFRGDICNTILNVRLYRVKHLVFEF